MPENWKDRLGTVYSTNKDYNYDYDSEEEQDTLPNEEQLLKVLLDRKARKGKTVTAIEGFVGTADDLKSLAKELKVKLGVGGSAKEGVIIIQTDQRDKLMTYLQDKGYKTKRVGG
ncbi:MAG: translation initiation factor [Flavobacteriales bacterium]